MTLSIIIVSYNVKYFLEQCLCSVTDAIKNIEAEVIVIDNCSSDNSIAYLQSFFPWVNFLSNTNNEGFAKANNKALQIASGKYILFLNPDTILAEDTLDQCIFFYEQHTKAGAIGVRMIDGSGNFLPESKRSFPSPLVSFYKLVGLSFLYPSSQLFGKYALGYLPQHDVHKVDVISGAFMMIPKQILDTVGGFDEQFFMYAEDIDLSYRIQKSNYENYYLGTITIVHFKGESTKKGSLNYIKIFYKAMSLFVKKWYRGAGSWLLRQGLHAGIAVRGFLSVINLPFEKKKSFQQTFFKKIILLGTADDKGNPRNIIEQHYPKTEIETIVYSTKLSPFLTNNLVVFCMGKLTYKTSIELLQQRNAASCKWFGKNSNSIVGSDSKNSSGDVLVNK